MPISNFYQNGYTIDSARFATTPTKSVEQDLKFSLRAFLLKSAENFLLSLFGITFLFPFYWMFSTSLKTLAETLAFPPTLLPQVPMWGNYAIAWNFSNFPLSAWNSIIVSSLVVILQLLVILPASYAFAFKNFRFSKLLFTLILVGLMIPPQVIFLPLYLLFSKFNMINTYIPLIIPFASSAFGIFLTTQSFRQIPRDIVESALLDGASELVVIWRILIPSVAPTIATFILFSFISHWNDYFWVLSMTNDENLRTLPLAVVHLTDSDGGVKNWHIKMAGNMILVAPVLLAYVSANKWIKRAFAYSGIK